MIDNRSEHREKPDEHETAKDRLLQLYLVRILLAATLIFLMSQSGVEARDFSNGSEKDGTTIPQFAAALMSLHARADYNRSNEFAFEETRASGSFVEKDGKLWFLSIEHAVNIAHTMETGILGPEGDTVTPDTSESWITSFSGNEPDRMDVSFSNAPPLVRGHDAAVLTEVSEDVRDELDSMGIKPFTNIESVTKETLDPSQHYYLITTFSNNLDGENSQVWIAELAPSTDDEYRKRYVENFPWMEQNPKFATTELINPEFLPFTVKQVLQPIENLVPSDNGLDASRFSSIAACQSMSGAVVVMSPIPIDEASTDDLTVIGSFSGPSYLTNPIPILDPNGDTMECSSVDDFLNVSPIPAFSDHG